MAKTYEVYYMICHGGDGEADTVEVDDTTNIASLKGKILARNVDLKQRVAPRQIRVYSSMADRTNDKALAVDQTMANITGAGHGTAANTCLYVYLYYALPHASSSRQLRVVLLCVPFVACLATYAGIRLNRMRSLAFCSQPPNASFKYRDETLGTLKVVSDRYALAMAFNHSSYAMYNATIVDHWNFRQEVLFALREPGFKLVLGPKHVGKTKVLKSVCAEHAHPCIYIDGRLHNDLVKALEFGLQSPQCQPADIMNRSIVMNYGRKEMATTRHETETHMNISLRQWLYGHWHPFVEGLMGLVWRIPDTTDASAALTRRTLNVTEWVEADQKTDDILTLFIWAMTNLAERVEKLTLILDEANEVLRHAEKNRNSLGSLITWSKQNSKIRIVMASSEGAFPYKFEACTGLSLLDVATKVYASELPLKEVKDVLQQWGLNEEEATKITAYFGGNLYAIHHFLATANTKCIGCIKAVGEVGIAGYLAQTQVKSLGTLGFENLFVTSRKFQLLVELAEQGWARIDAGEQAAKELVEANIAYLLVTPFSGYVASDFIPDDDDLAILVPISRMMRIAVADELCADAWQKAPLKIVRCRSRQDQIVQRPLNDGVRMGKL